MNPNALNIKWGQGVNGTKIAYIFQIEKALIEMRENNKSLLL